MHPILFKFHSFTIYSYGLALVIAFYLSIYLVIKEAKKMREAGRESIDTQAILDIALIILISGIIGGKLAYILLNLPLYIETPLEPNLAGIILSGQLLAVFLNNSGGAWDNAKKTIEDEAKDPVGDPFKDTAGPALNPMIKVVNLVALIVAPIVVANKNLGLIGWIFVILLLAGLVWAILQSKKPAARISEMSTSPGD